MGRLGGGDKPAIKFPVCAWEEGCILSDSDASWFCTIEDPTPSPPGTLSSLPPTAARWKGRSPGWGGWSSNLLFVCFRSGLFANYQMGLYLNKNQFSAAPPLLLGSVGTPCWAACVLEGDGGLLRILYHLDTTQNRVALLRWRTEFLVLWRLSELQAALWPWRGGVMVDRKVHSV